MSDLRDLGHYEAEKVQELLARLNRLQTVDMALIVSPGQNEIEQMKARGLDIVPHRKRINDSQPPLDEKFKDPEDPLSLVFVCAMWLTGFDAPSCSTVYLDKPMRNHTLMQTIARANRVFPGKHSGMIVDYANVFASLEKALAIYGAGTGGKTPVRDKKKLVEDLKRAVEEATLFCANKGVVLPAIEQLPAGSMQRLERIDDAVNALISPDPLRKEFLGHERIVKTLYSAVKPDVAALEFAPRVSCLSAIADAIRAQVNRGTPDISGVMGEINTLLDASIEGVTMSAKPAPVLDLSKIDFETLARRFKESKRKNIDLETLKAAIRALLERLIRLNRSRTDFQEKFEELIEAYNAGSKNIEELFSELVALSRALTEEQTRHVRENLTEEDLRRFEWHYLWRQCLSRDRLTLKGHTAGVTAVAFAPGLSPLGELMVMNYRAARLNKRQRAMLDFAVKLTVEPWAVEESDRAALRRAGFTARDIWDIAAVAGFFNMSNRVASATDMRPNRVYHAQAR
jgi:type I restriction enzyme R subunit